ncbi:Histidine phosphatase superfamily (branch 1) [seawater metagenome]|uniref:Histidine phosphatase superfamily (Branch 1) n=1 Tax=seawater metagenome TaxID=1561972 RepID=A0A5E8CLZ4_9ZZZZ
MRIYTLRHQERFNDATMFAPLTLKGLENSKKLVPILNRLGINYIYSSPYMRTLQTIYPYSKTTDTKVNLEYGLIETLRHPNIPKSSYNSLFPQYLSSQFNFNKNYSSVVKNEDLKFNETDKNLEKRIKNVLHSIIKTHGSKNDRILIVSHMTPINTIIKIGGKSNHTIMPKDYPLSYEYPIGAVTEIFSNNQWTFNKVNW